MKKNITFYIILTISLFFFGNGYAQNTENRDESLVESQERFITLNQLENNTAVQAIENMVGNNAVFIQQIGTGNKVFSTITAQSSDIRLNQNGEQNLIDINETSREIEKFITQNGNNNIVTDFSFNPDISTNLEILQEGDNLSFERFGSNELSKNLKFKMTGNARTIIVRSF